MFTKPPPVIAFLFASILPNLMAGKNVAEEAIGTVKLYVKEKL